ncbi:C13 family peptidase [Methylomagnum ishizawai]|uniref:C13 family peptidase n=1 Tax=Methylomagnum ishizawai TaxID=1760988 RepID=UPI001C33E500|nr:C13 family peptidase [Methylomagnum ishizawai]BBL76243.1 hypothetical protein MishRS11D_33410 [Methylomagnum ishizawai]
MKPRMEIRYEPTPADTAAHLRHLRDQGRPPDPPLWIVLLGLGLGLAVAARTDAPDWRDVLLFGTAALFGLSGLALALWRRCYPDTADTAPPTGVCRLVVTPAGLVRAAGPEAGFLAWPDLAALVEGPEHFHLHAVSGPLWTLPKRALPEPDGPRAFADLVRRYWQAQPGHRRRRLPDRPERPGRRVLAGFAEALRGGFRLALFRPLEGGAVRTLGGGVLAGLLALRLGVSALGDYAAALPRPRFDAYGLIDHGAGMLLFLLSGLALGGLARDTKPLLGLLGLIAAAEWLTSALYRLAYAALPGGGETAAPWIGWALFLAWFLWNFAIVFRAVGGVYRQPAPVALFLASAFALLDWGVGFQLPVQEIFYPAEDEATAAPAPRIDAEEVLYRQHRLLREATDALAPQRPGVADLYFVGFAGESDEQVFAHEVGYALDLFDRRFDTQGRSIALVNSPDTLVRWPIANRHALDAALQAVARRMDPKEDVLFLFLTSHGSKDHKLSVRFEPLPLDDLPAATLKAALDRAGIRQRIVVVSACYSGGFLDALKDDDSLILTAARRDRASFGCGVDSEFTYFGQAYFVEALAQTRSFVAAFDMARQTIERREQAEGNEPSLPQIHVGKNIAPKLRALEQRLAAPAAKPRPGNRPLKP